MAMTEQLEYRYPVESLITGSSLGNMHAFARCSERTDLLGFWLAADNQYYIGEWTIRSVVNGVPATAEETVFRPESQTTISRAGRVVIEQTMFLPVFPEGQGNPSAERSVMVRVRVRNDGKDAAGIAIHHFLTFPAMPTEKFTKQPPQDQQEKRVSVETAKGVCVATTIGRPNESRVFGADRAWSTMTATPTTIAVSYDLRLSASETDVVTFRCTGSPYGAREATAGSASLADGTKVLALTMESFSVLLSRSTVCTPDGLVNRALQWAKINMMRVTHQYRIGEAFTNDPPQDIVVIRDLAWFTLGMDAFNPELSRRMLLLACGMAVADGGKLAEYFHADEEPPILHDYNLNINDDTPLFVWALAHHAWMTGDREFLRLVYPTMVQACEWILAQTTDGLVRCTAGGTNVWGICSWRNIIDEYTLAGAVTEINAECFAALTLTSEAARSLEDADIALRFSDAARTLRLWMNARLRSGRSGMYLLNVDNEGREHHDLTGDLVFPLLTDVADDDLREKILARLMAQDFWTPYGVRTVPPGEPMFDPDRGYQLVGGVWPNLTAWVAYCLRSSHPAKLVEAMKNIFRISEEQVPAQHGFVVPGEFPERLHGTNFQSRGMTLSPWTPPTYFWLGVEGLLGLRSTSSGIELNPALPDGWHWIAVKDLPVHGKRLSAFVHDGLLYTSMPLHSRFPVHAGEIVATTSEHEDLFVIALEIQGEVVVFVSGERNREGGLRYEWKNSWQEIRFRLDSTGAGVFRSTPKS